MAQLQHSTIGRKSATLQLFDTVDQKLPEATGERVLCFLIVLITGVGHHDIFNFGKKKNFFFFFFLKTFK